MVDANEDDLYAAMDWLLARQDAIEKKLAARHLREGGLVLYDLSSSYFEGTTCPLAKRGYSRDGKHGMLQVNYGLLTDARGCPVAVSVHEGNTADSQTLLPEVQRLRDDFGIERMVMVGDRGMISQKAIDAMRETDGIGWITALKSASIRALVEQGHLQLDLFDERNLLELSSPDYPGERLVACRNPQLWPSCARTSARSCWRPPSATSTRSRRGWPPASSTGAGRDRRARGQGHQPVQGRQALRADHRRMPPSPSSASPTASPPRPHSTASTSFARRCPTRRWTPPECVRNYKALANVERAFRSLKTIDLKVRPIHHRTADRVRAHIFLCMLAYYVEWHLREAWRELMFADTEQQAKATRDPVAPATRSASRSGQGRSTHASTTARRRTASPP